VNIAAISLSVWICLAIQIFWLAYGIIRFASRNDELPLAVAIFLAYCGGYRYLGTIWGWFEWGSLQAFGLYGVSADASSVELALKALVFGESILLGTYCYFQTQIVVPVREQLPALLLARLRSLLAILAPLSVLGTLLAHFSISRSAAAGLSFAFEVSSYVLLFPQLLVSVAILTVLAWRFGALKTAGQKLGAGAFLGIVCCLTFGTTGRFQFLGWMVASAYLISTARFGLQRILVLAVGGALALTVFGIAGALRGYTPGDGNLVSAGLERTKSAEDANMLDGFTYLMKVYPDMLPYSLGGEHFEILLRPIPRRLWPGKPVGGYMNKLHLFDSGSSVTVGISPTLIGDFYAEGGWLGIIICSVIYGWGVAWLVRYSISMRMIFGTLIRACLIVASIPLLRGGDLPGVYALLGMAFWPVLLFLWWNRSFLHARENAISKITVRKNFRRQELRKNKRFWHRGGSSSPFKMIRYQPHLHPFAGRRITAVPQTGLSTKTGGSGNLHPATAKAGPDIASGH
jgi:hypothetical protein